MGSWHGLMAHIPWPLLKPIKFLELDYTMTQFLIIQDVREQTNAIWYFQVNCIRQSWLLDILYIYCFRSNAWEEPSLLLLAGLISISLFLTDSVIMKFVLPISIYNLLISPHFFTFASSEFINCSSDFKSLAEAKTLVSSAKILKHNFQSNLANRLCTLKTKEVLMCSLVECHITLSALVTLPAM